MLSSAEVAGSFLVPDLYVLQFPQLSFQSSDQCIYNRTRESHCPVTVR